MSEQQQFYWELIQRDGTVIEIPPEAVDTVKRRWDAGQPIHTKYQGSIPAGQIVAFRPTAKLVSQTPLLEEVAQAFKEPMITKDPKSGEELVKAYWVKKPVPQSKWEKYYSATGSYRKLGDEMGMVIMAFVVPVHQIDLNKVQYCNEEEIGMLERN